MTSHPCLCPQLSISEASAHAASGMAALQYTATFVCVQTVSVEVAEPAAACAQAEDNTGLPLNMTCCTTAMRRSDKPCLCKHSRSKPCHKQSHDAKEVDNKGAIPSTSRLHGESTHMLVLEVSRTSSSLAKHIGFLLAWMRLPVCC